MAGDPYPEYGPIARRRAEGHEYARRRVRRRRARRRLPVAARVGLTLVGALLVLLVVGATIGLLQLDRAYRGRIVDGVMIQGLDVSRMRPDDARTALQQRYATFLAAPVTFQLGERRWQPAPDRVGVSIDVDDVVARAYAVGRGADLFRSAADAVAAWRNSVDLPLRVTVDQRQLQAYLTTVANDVEIAPQDASLSVMQGRLLTMPTRFGRQVLVDETAREVLAALPVLQPHTVTLRTRVLRPLVEDTGIAAAQAQINALLQAPVTLTAGAQRWTWTAEELGDLVQITREPRADSPGLRIAASLDRGLLERRLRRLAAVIDATPVEPRVRLSADGPRIVTPGANGARLEIEQAVEQVAAALWREQRTIDLPILVLQPRARPDTLASLGIVELVGQGKSSFENSAPYRVQNIQAGARQMNGVLIGPGEEFSFNRTVGAIDESNGFTQGYAIIDGRTQLEWGGGVCQVSTTVFRAAFWAGVPITERNQHTFRIRWYEQFEPIGMDAAIFTGPGGYDLRFVNDTGRWLLLETVVDTTDEVLTVNLYGTKPGREVIQTPPSITNEVPAPSEPRYVDDPQLPAGTVKQTDTARGGMDVRVGRIVKLGGAVLYQDTFFSRYQPWPNIFVRGTGREQ